MRQIDRVLRALSRLAVAGLLWAGAAQAEYVVNLFTLPGAVHTSIWGTNDLGHLVGSADDGVTGWAFVYRGGAVTRLDGPAGAVGASAIGISNTGVVVGNWFDGSGSHHPYVYSGGRYTLTDLGIAGASDLWLRGVSPDGRYATGYYTNASGWGGGFIYDLGVGAVVRTIDADASFLIAQGINSFGQVVGDYTAVTPTGTVRAGFLYDMNTGTRTDFTFAGVDRLAPRAINDHGQMAGWLTQTGDPLMKGWIGNASGYQIISTSATRATVGEGMNNLGQVVGFQLDDEGFQNPGFVASPAIGPDPGGSGDPHVYKFTAAVVADKPIFIDPLVAVGYAYKTGVGDPLFKTVSLPVGIGDNVYEIVVGDQHFAVAGNQIFDFTANGFAGGVAEFTVLGIEPEALLDPADSNAFVTRLTFAASGMFTGTQTALTLDYTPPVPEPGGAALALAGLAVLGALQRRRLPAATR